MATPLSDGDARVDVLEFVGRRAATHWLLGHLDGLHHVPVPDTGLFDAEGVLEAWVYSCGSTLSRDRQVCCIVLLLE